MVFPETLRAGVFPVALRLREGIRARSAVMGSPIQSCLGVAEWHPDDSVDELLGRADEVIRASKRLG